MARHPWRAGGAPAVVALALVLAVAGCGGSRPVTVPAAGAAATSMSALSGPGPQPSVGPGRVVDTDDVGDPSVVRVPAGADGPAHWVLFYTTDWQSNVPTAVSTDLVHWRRVADALPVLPVWAVDSRTMTWGPSAQQVRAGWVLYFSTLDRATGRECIGAATSTRAEGPYHDGAARPLVCQSRLDGSIDPSVLRSDHGATLVWKSESSPGGHASALWSARLTPAGTQLAGPIHHLLTADRPWQHGVVEGPAMLADSAGGWWLFYSGGSWESGAYDTGVAWCATVTGPCRESTGRPWLVSAAGRVSPGGFDTFVGPGGRLWASWSTFPAVPGGPQQAMAMDRDLTVAPVLAH